MVSKRETLSIKYFPPSGSIETNQINFSLNLGHSMILGLGILKKINLKTLYIPNNFLIHRMYILFLYSFWTLGKIIVRVWPREGSWLNEVLIGLVYTIQYRVHIWFKIVDFFLDMINLFDLEEIHFAANAFFGKIFINS